jgi:hypothetical protein
MTQTEVMRAIEFLAKVTPEGTILVPNELAKNIPAGAKLRVMILVKEDNLDEEDADWERLGIEQFFAGYAPEDSMYDNYKQP